MGQSAGEPGAACRAAGDRQGAVPVGAPLYQVLLVEADDGDARGIIALMQSRPYGAVVRRCGSLHEALERLGDGGFEVVLLDPELPDSSGPATLHSLLTAYPELPLVALTAAETDEFVDEAVRLGAQDCLAKSRLDPDLLHRTLRHAIERRAAARELQEQQALSRAIVERTADGIYLVDADTMLVIDVNPALAEMLGYARDDLVGRPLTDLVAHESTEIAQRLVQVLLEGQVLRQQRTYRRRDGSEVEVEVSATALPHAGRRVVCNVVCDITARLRDERELRSSRELFRSALDALAAQIVILDAEGRIVELNRAWRQFAADNGLPEAACGIGADYLGTAPQRGLPQLLVGQATDGLQTVMNGERTSFELEYPCELTCGQYWLALRVTAFPGDAGQVVVAHEDLTERRRAETSAAWSESRYRDLFHNANDAILVHDLKGQILDANILAARRLGYTVQALSQRPLAELEADEFRATVPQRIDAVDRYGSQLYETVLVSRAGLRMPVEVSARRIDYDGVPAVICTARDISERKRTVELYQRLATALSAAAEAILITDREGRIQYVNEAFVSITGYGPEQVIGRNPSLLKSGCHPPEFYVELWAALNRGESWRGQITNRRRDGSFYTARTTIAPVRDAQGRVTEYVATQQDITSELRLQAEVGRNQMLQAVGQLAAGVAHDFNNILLAVLGFADLIGLDLPDDSPLADDVDQIRQAARRGGGLVRQLMAFSLQEPGERVPVDLNQIVGDIIKMLRRTIGEHITVELELADTLPMILADSVQMQQVLMNLAVNARDAMPSGGRLRIATAAETCPESGGENGQRCVQLTVEDTGTGMSPEVLERAFEPYFTTKEQGRGTGLGLATVIGSVEQNGGRVSLESELGTGTTVTVRMPVCSADRLAAAEAAAAAPPQGHGETILVVEDEALIRDMVCRLLTANGYLAYSAADGFEALDLLAERQGDVDLVITDMVMPRMTGSELLERLAVEYPDLRVVVSSGYAADQLSVAEDASRHGLFLAKPYSSNALLTTLRRALEG